MSYWKSDAPETKPSRDMFLNYVVTQTMGRYNMLSQDARDDVGCTDGEYNYILHHYLDLSIEYGIDGHSDEVRSRIALREKWGF